MTISTEMSYIVAKFPVKNHQRLPIYLYGKENRPPLATLCNLVAEVGLFKKLSTAPLTLQSISICCPSLTFISNL